MNDPDVVDVGLLFEVNERRLLSICVSDFPLLDVGGYLFSLILFVCNCLFLTGIYFCRFFRGTFGIGERDTFC